MPNPTLITRIATRQEAIGTSALEGTFANLTDLLTAEDAEIAGDSDRFGVPPNVREVMNYTRAADRGYSWVQDRPIGLQMLSALQAIIVRGTEADGSEAGAPRTQQVFIGANNRRVTDARFIPPPAQHVRPLYEDWVKWAGSDEVVSRLPAVVRLALSHYQFETIHPYTDGNGRLGRLIVVLQLLRERILRAPVLSLSPWLKEHAVEYRDHLLEVSRSGDWEPWVRFFAEAVAVSSRDNHDRIMRLLELRREIGDKVRKARPRARLAVEIADDLIAYPILSVSGARARHGRTNEANRIAIAQLVDLGVLEPFSDARYDRLYWSPRVYQAINA